MKLSPLTCLCLSWPPCSLRDFKTAVNYVTINKMADQNSEWRMLNPCNPFNLCIYISTQLTFLYLKQVLFPHILITSRNCLNFSCHIDPYIGGFSCSCNLARLLVRGGAIGQHYRSLLGRGEFGCSYSGSWREESGLCLLFLSAAGFSTFSGTLRPWSNAVVPPLRLAFRQPSIRVRQQRR